MHKFLLITLLTVTTTAFCHDPIQDAILNSDYDAVAQYYAAQETPENLKRAYLALADDTAMMRSTNLAFDWAKAFISAKLLLSAYLTYDFGKSFVKTLGELRLKKTNHALYQTLFPKDEATADAKLCFGLTCVSLSFFIWALADGNKYYYQLQDKIKDAERIKFLIMAQS